MEEKYKFLYCPVYRIIQKNLFVKSFGTNFCIFKQSFYMGCYFMSRISDIIDNRLNELNIKGSKMCDDLGLSRSTLTELRKGRVSTLKSDRAAAIARYLGITTDYLLGAEPNSIEIPVTTEPEINIEDIRVAFFDGAQDLSDEEMNEYWKDAKDYIQYKIAKKRREYEEQDN